MHIGKASISNLPAVPFDGVYRVLGMIPSTDESLEGFPEFGSMMAAPLDPRQWQDIDLQWYNLPVWDQHATSSCVGQGSTMGMQYCWKQQGKPFVEFNPYFVYGFINGGRDAGAMISDSLRKLINIGTCLKNDLRQGMMFENQFPRQAVENAKRFRLIQAYRCQTFEDICSAITLGFVVPLGIWVDQNFSRIDREGVSGVPSGNSGGGHCILGMGLKRSSRYGWLIKTQNSWGRKFGMNGFSYIHKGHFRRIRPDAFAIQTTSDDPMDNDPTDDVPVVTS